MSLLTRLVVRNFKTFDEIDIELGKTVVFVGPNNSGKSSALQALALWDLGLKRWIGKRHDDSFETEEPHRAGVTINRRDLTAIPVPSSNLLWRDRQIGAGAKGNEERRNRKVPIEIYVEAIVEGKLQRCGLEFVYANEESIYCRPSRANASHGMQVAEGMGRFRIAYLPSMSGLVAQEVRLETGAVNVRLGEGRTAEVLRNLCYRTLESNEGESKWGRIVARMESLFGVKLNDPAYRPERGEIEMSFETRNGTKLDLSSGGRGQQQTLLLLAHMAVNPGSVLLLDEPDAHLEILRQRQIYQMLTDEANETGNQIIAATHSEVILNEAADRDIVIAFVGKPHRIDDRGVQLRKSLREIGFDQYYSAERRGWVLYMEGATDLAMLREFARKMSHPAFDYLQSPFVHYVANQPVKARDHFYALREALPGLLGIGIFDHLGRELPKEPNLQLRMWTRREFENYFSDRATLLNYAEASGKLRAGESSAAIWKARMADAIDEISDALKKLDKDPWDKNFKVSDEFLGPLFKRFFVSIELPNLMLKSDYHELIEYLPADRIDDEVRDFLDTIVQVAAKARPKE